MKAIVRLRDGQALEEQELKDFIAETLAYFKVPAYVEFREEPFPRNATGKILKPVLTGEAENTFEE